MGKRTILVWFRNDLRIHDNEILLRAVERGQQIVPVYCFDPRHFAQTKFGTRKTGALRAAFLLENVLALRQSLMRLGGDLVIAFGPPEDVLPKLAKKHGVDEVYHHREVAYEETFISARVEEALWQMQINLRHFIGHTLYHKEDLPFPIKDIPDAFAIFKKKTERESTIRPQLVTPHEITVPEDLDVGHVPDLADLGFSEVEIQLTLAGLPCPGGESAALDRMERFLFGQHSEMDYACLSPYIAVGALSPNTLYHAAKEAERTTLDRKRVEQINLKLLWRDYYRFMFKKHGNRFFRPAGITGQPLDSRDNDADFDRWKNGNTGHPIVDRAMRQLNGTGRIPHHERLILASYLVHEIQGNWLRGAAWFEEKLLDYNPANNYGNWAHVAGVGSSVKDNRPVDFRKLSTQFYPKEVAALG